MSNFWHRSKEKEKEKIENLLAGQEEQAPPEIPRTEIENNKIEDTIKDIDYQSLLKDETIQALMNHLNITANVSTILYNEQILFLLNATKSNEIKINEGKDIYTYKKRSRNFTIKKYLMGINQEYQNFKDENPYNLKEIAQKRFLLHAEVIKYSYGITDLSLIDRHYDKLEVIAEGELYKMLNDYWNNWDMEAAVTELNNIIQFTKVKLQKNVIKQEKLFNTKDFSDIVANRTEEKKNKEPIPTYSVDEFVKKKQEEKDEGQINYKDGNIVIE